MPGRDIVVIEDSLAGKIAANKARIDVIMVNQSKADDAGLYINHAFKVKCGKE